MAEVNQIHLSWRRRHPHCRRLFSTWHWRIVNNGWLMAGIECIFNFVRYTEHLYDRLLVQKQNAGQQFFYIISLALAARKYDDALGVLLFFVVAAKPMGSIA